MTTPTWALSLAYWVHMLATVTWIGGLAALAIFVLPAAHKSLDRNAYPAFLADIRRRLDPLAWLSLVLLVATGLFQMSANPNYQGFLAINNRWAVAILIKHLVFIVMTGISAYLTWGILPAMQRAALRLAHGQQVLESQALQRREIFLMRLNLALGLIVLGLTAIARAA
ncbi:MAG: CopD family protein [Anaerolineales bacterium]